MKKALVACALSLIAFVGIGLAWSLASDPRLGQPSPSPDSGEASPVENGDQKSLAATTDPLVAVTPFAYAAFGVPVGIHGPIENRSFTGSNAFKASSFPTLAEPMFVRISVWSEPNPLPSSAAQTSEPPLTTLHVPVATLLTPIFKPLAVPKMTSQTLFFPMPEPTSPVWELNYKGSFAQTLIFPTREPEETTPARESIGTVTTPNISDDTAPERMAPADSEGVTGHDENYRWITGVLTRKGGVPNVWFIRYLPPDAPGDFHGGCVAIQTNVAMNTFREGDLVTATGYIIRDAAITPNLSGAAYAADGVKQVK